MDMLFILIGTFATNGFFQLFNPAYTQGIKGVYYIIIADIILCFLVQLGIGSYSKTWKYYGLKDYLTCAGGMLAGQLFSFVIFSVLQKGPSKLFFVVNFVVITLLAVLFRIVFRKTFIILTRAGRETNTQRTLIIGAGRAATMILSELEGARFDEGNVLSQIEPIGLIDDDAGKAHLRIKGIPVLGTTKDIPDIVRNQSIDQILFAIPSASKEERKRILDICTQTKCRIKVIPYLGNLLFDEEHTQLISQAVDIKIEDLLGRDTVAFDKEVIKKFITGKVCMVTGGGGSIGSELVRQIASYKPRQVIIVDIYENNAYDVQQEVLMEYGDTIDLVTIISSVRDYDKMEAIFKKYRPELVFHAAAHKHVPLMETVPEEAVKNNVFGTFNVATLAEYYKAKKFVLISTD